MTRLLKGILYFLVLVLMVCVPCEAHHWYPYECCHEMDCGPIINIYYLNDNSKLIVIKLDNGELRSATFPENFQIRSSLDEKQHACISNSNQPMCLFLTGGV